MGYWQDELGEEPNFGALIVLTPEKDRNQRGFFYLQLKEDT